MVAYSFKHRFVHSIIAGLVPGPLTPGMKRQTIRADRKRHARPGEELQLYTGMRTRACTLLGRATCVAVVPVTLMFGRSATVTVGGRIIRGASALDDFATWDGFTDWSALVLFWAEEHASIDRFSGVLIRWQAKKDT